MPACSGSTSMDSCGRDGHVARRRASCRHPGGLRARPDLHEIRTDGALPFSAKPADRGALGRGSGVQQTLGLRDLRTPYFRPLRAEQGPVQGWFPQRYINPSWSPCA